MGISLGNCCSAEKLTAMNIFKAPDEETIKINIQAPSSIETKKRFQSVGADQNRNVSVKDFEMIRFLGKGAFGKVMLVRQRGTSSLFAMKIIEKRRIRNKYTLNCILTERAILMRSNHPYIVKLRYSFQNQNYVFFVMDYLKGGALSKYLTSVKGRGLPEGTVRYYAAQVLLALEHLHEKMRAVYRDLKPDNILLDEQGNIRLADFGIAKSKINS